MGERLPYKQRVIGSSPVSSIFLESLAQLVEHLTFNQRVGRSNRLVGICGSSSVVEHHLAMVGVAGSNPVFRFAGIFSELNYNRLICTHSAIG